MNHLKSMPVVIYFVILFIWTLCTAAPVPIPVSKISGGESHSLFLTKANSIWGCGDNQYRQLGDGTYNNRYVPVQVHGLNDVNCLQNVIEISAGWKHSLVLDTNHRMWAWGDNYYGELGVPGYDYSAVPIQVRGGEQGAPYLQNIICISAGRSGQHSLAIDANHYVWSWGINNYGQLGNGKSGDFNTLPVRVHAGWQTPGEPNAHPLRYIIKVSAGANHSMALDANGFVWTWGDNGYHLVGNGYGKLGINNTVNDHNTTPVKVLAGEQDPNHPTTAPLKNIVAISAGWDHCMALEKIDANNPNNCKGRVYTWGTNGIVYDLLCSGGRLGDGTIYTNRPMPVMVHAGRQDPNHPNDIPLKNIIAISAGESHCIALEKLDVVHDSNCRGRVYTWGDNYYGQLGTSNNNDYITPVRVLAPDRDGDGQPDDLDGNSNTTDYLGDDVPIVYISAGYWHSIAVDANGRVYSWGKNVDENGGRIGQLGIGAKGNKNIPTPLFYIYDLNVYNQRTGKGYKRIQPAINEAINNDVIVVCQGNYSENVYFGGDKTITLRSVDPNNWSVVNNTRICGSADVAITLDHSGSKITGLTMFDSDDGIYCSYADSTITRCRIENNQSYGICAVSTDIVVDRCNIADNGFGGINACDPWGTYPSPVIKITNNVINHNSSYGINLPDDMSSEIRNNTIADNNSYGICKASYYTDPDVNSNIIWGNVSGGLTSSGSSFGKVNYNCIQDGWSSGTGNTSLPPQFRNSTDYHLKYNSPCIDKGDPNFSSSTETDIDGEDRIMDGNNSDDICHVDMGADEYCPYDLVQDGFINFFDFRVVAGTWKKHQGQNGYNKFCDFHHDDVIDFKDLRIFCAYWLCPSNEIDLGGQGAYFAENSGGGEMEMMMSVSPANTLAGSAESQEDLSSASDEMMMESQEDEQESMMPDYNLPAIYLTCDTNTPDPNDEVTVWVHSEAPLFAMGMGIYVIGDANITTAMSEADCNQFGWDNGWNSDPYIDPNGYVFISGVRWDADANGTVGYIKFRYHSGQISVYIDQQYSLALGWDGESCPIVPLSQEALLIGRDPNDPNEP